MLVGTCWRCEEPGHIADDCDRGPAETEAEVKARITRYMDRRIAGLISTGQKRAWVKAEWKALREYQKARKAA